MERIKSLGTILLGIVVFAIIIVTIGAFIKGVAWVSETVLPFTKTLVEWTIIIAVIALLFSFVEKTRSVAGNIVFISSYIFGLHLWLFSALVSYSLWGFYGLLIGLVIGGIGVLPVAIIASLLKGLWGVLGLLVGGIIIVYGARMLSLFILSKCKNKEIDVISETHEPISQRDTGI